MATAQRLPAWKRLGLKLKDPAAAIDEIFPAPSIPEGRPPNALTQKRKLISTQSPAPSLQVEKKRKSVSFTEYPENNGHLRAKQGNDSTKTPFAKKKKAKKDLKCITSKAEAKVPDLHRQLEYLEQWKLGKLDWKFNKNHQNLLIKYVFTADWIPSSHINTFYEYIRELQGGVRSRLCLQAADICKGRGANSTNFVQDSIKPGKEAEKDSGGEACYEQLVKEIQEKISGGSGSSGSSGNCVDKSTPFIDELDSLSRLSDPGLQHRLRSRIRALNILVLLQDDFVESAVSSTPAPDESETEKPESHQLTNNHAHGEQAKPRNDSANNKKAPRNRKKRTILAVDSSSESESSDSESSAS